jgi:serine/threonine protein kinase
MEFIDGPTLKALFDENRRFALTDIAFILGGILNALQYSHDRKVVHRDMKPANVMFTRDNTVKITDFGIARLEDSDMTQAGMVIGTPAYMSPEQFLGDTVDWRTDIYSTGVLLYQILTGERPYEGTLATIMHKVLYGTPLLPSRLSTVATPALDKVITRAMARKREERFDTAAQFNAELQKALAGQATKREQTPAPAERPIPVRPSSSQTAYRPAIFASIAAAILVAGGGIAWFLHGSPPEPQIAVTQTSQPREPEPPPVANETKTEPVAAEPVQEAATDQHEPVYSAPPPDSVRPAPEPFEPPRVFPPPDTAPAYTPPVKKPPAAGSVAKPTVPDQKRPAQTVNKSSKPLPEPPNPKVAMGEESTAETLHRLRNGAPDHGGATPDPSPEPVLYAETSSSSVGLLCQTVTADTAGNLGLDAPHGMVVIGVVTGSAAAAAGIRQEDVILKIDGTEARNLSALRKVTGSSVPVELFRHGSRRVVQLEVDQGKR